MNHKARNRYDERDLALIRKAVHVSTVETGLQLNVDITTSLPLGLRVHSGERDATLKRLMKQSGAIVTRTARCCAFPLERAGDAQKLQETIAQKLTALAQKPLSLRQVERVLKISPTERLRWSKDGRLRRSGTAEILRSSKILLYTYPPQEIERLLADPEIIATWRRADRQNA